MTITTEAWVLHIAPPGRAAERATLRREEFSFPDITDDEVLAEPLFGCWEGNMGHALERKPLDICHARGEDKVVFGNAGVVRVLETGKNVTSLRAGQVAMLFGGTVCDAFGYPQRVFGFDAPGTIGLLAKKTKLSARELIPLPENSKYTLPQWAAFSVRYVTAWSNWELAIGALRLQLRESELPHPHVWAWGGGTSLAQLELAKRFGCHTVMLSGNDQRLAEITRSGITALDKRTLGDLDFDEHRFSTDLTFRRAYSKAESAFLKEVAERTGGQGVHVFVDHIGTAVFRPTIKALSRQGVVCTAGWKAGQMVTFLRAMECIARHQHIHTHYARYEQGLDAVRYAETHGWLPRLGERVYAYDEIPRLAESFLSGDHELFPIYAVNPV